MVSVMRMRERSFLCDLDILDLGSVRDMIRCTGAMLGRQCARACRDKQGPRHQESRTGDGLRVDQVRPIGVVEVGGALAGKLEVLLLVMANGHMGSSAARISHRQRRRMPTPTHGQVMVGGVVDVLTCGQECRQPGGPGRKGGQASVGSRRDALPAETLAVG